jgi:endonuclease/exonuclease/phosphatase (EEP) superfamily protein YafD
MFYLGDVREAQAFLNEKRLTEKDADKLRNLSTNVRFKWDALDNLLKALRQQGYKPVKHLESETNKLF